MAFRHGTLGRVTTLATADVFRDRLDRVRKRMVDQDIDVLMLSVGHDLPYLTGYLAMPLERLTMLVVPRDGEASLLIPQLEAPRVVEHPDVFTLVPWGETADPIEASRPNWPTGHRRSRSVTRCGPASSSSCWRTSRG